MIRPVVVSKLIVFVVCCLNTTLLADEKPVPRDNDRTIRLLLLLPGGPIILDADVTIDRRPFREIREKYIDRTLEAADLDRNGRVSLDEAVADGKLFAARFPYVKSKSHEARLAELKVSDADNDGLISKPEAHSIVAGHGGGPAFSLLEAAYRPSMARAPVRELLDLDNDGSINQREIAASESRLKSRDKDDNDILSIGELTRNSVQPLMVSASSGVQATSLLVHLFDATDWQAVERVLRSRYGGDVVSTTKHFQLTQRLAKRLDKDSDGIIDSFELAAMLQVAPHLCVEANFGRTGDLPEGITLKSVSDELKTSIRVDTNLGNTVMIELPGTHLQLTASTIKRNFTKFQEQARAYMRFDANKNGYLEKPELNNQKYLTQIFEQADEDGNEQVFVDELETFFRRGIELQMNRISAAAADQGNSLFDALDSNGDRRLNAREIRNASERLKHVDKSGDGTVTFEEIPTTIRVALARGSYAAQALNNVRRSSMGENSVRPSSQNLPDNAPRWFFRMDRNGDGDVSRREFLGKRKQFDKLDLNDDGFIEPKEAEAVGESPSSDD